MRRTEVEAARRAALKALIPQAHWLAHSFAQGRPSRSDLRFVDALRQLAHRLDSVATHGTELEVNRFFDG